MSMKESYQQKLQDQLGQWSAEIDKLKARADKADANIKLEYYEQIEDLRVKQEAVKEKLADLMSASDDAWEDLKAEVENAWSSLGESIESATKRFK